MVISPMITLKFDAPELTQQISKLQKTLDPETLLPGLQIELQRVMTDHLTANYASKPNKLGAPSTGYWKDVIETMDSEIVGDTVRLDLSQRGIALHFFGSAGLPGGKVVPKGISEITGKPITRLTIPAIPAAHGKSVAEIPGLKFGQWDKGFGLGKDGTLFFWLARSVTISADPAIIPATLEATLTTWLSDQLPDV